MMSEKSGGCKDGRSTKTACGKTAFGEGSSQAFSRSYESAMHHGDSNARYNGSGPAGAISAFRSGPNGATEERGNTELTAESYRELVVVL